MGWNEARVTLVPNGWNLVVQQIVLPNAAGQTARLISTEKSLDYSGDLMLLGLLESWLLSRGFRGPDEFKGGKRYRRDDLLVSVYVEGEEVSEISLEFTLTRDSPTRWPAWQHFVADLCQAWPVALADSEAGMKVGPDGLFRLLRRGTSWQDFERSFNWNCGDTNRF